MGESCSTGKIWPGYKSRWDKLFCPGASSRLALYHCLPSGRIVGDDLGACLL